VITYHAELRILREARALITHPEHWTKGDLACDSRGNRVATDSPCAYAYCARGSIWHTGNGAVGAAVNRVQKRVDAVSTMLYPCKASRLLRWLHPHVARVIESEQRTVIYVNDWLGHDAVLRVFDTAIAQLEELCAEEDAIMLTHDRIRLMNRDNLAYAEAQKIACSDTKLATSA